MPITLEMLKKMLLQPHNFLPRVEKEHIATTVVVMCLNWIIAGLAIGITFNNFVYTLAVLVFGIMFDITASFFITVALIVMGGKGKFKNALDSLVYPYFGLSVSTLLISLIFKVASTFSLVIAPILLGLYTTIGYIGTIRVLKDSFRLEAITVCIAITIVILALFVSLYSAVVLYYSQSLKSFPPFF